MKILLVCENYYPHYGGAELLFKMLAEGYVQRGHEVTVLTHRLKNTAKEEALHGVKIIRIASLHSRYVFSFAAIFKAVKLAGHFDIIQTTTFNGVFPAWLAAKMRRKPVVLTVHEVWVGRWQEIAGFSWWKSLIHDGLERLLYCLPFDRYVCVSETTKNDLLTRRKDTIKVVMIYNGMDYDFWNAKHVSHREREKIRQDLKLDNKVVAFSWGRPGNSKGFEYLIKAVPEIVKSRPDFTLLLMFGSVEKYCQKFEELRQLVEGIKVKEHFKVISSVDDEQLRTYLAIVDLAVVPSISEGFGFNALQAAAMEKPILISDAGSLPEIVGGRYQIFKAKDQEDLARKALLLMDGKYLERKARKFLWEDTVERYLGEYESLLSPSILPKAI